MRKPFDLLLELGRVNEAEHVALEMLEDAPCGGTLKRLALVKLIKGQTAAARVVLQVLRDDLVWGRWADEYLHRLAADPTLAGDDEIQRMRRIDDRGRRHGRLAGKPGQRRLRLRPPAVAVATAEAEQREPNGHGVSPGDMTFCCAMCEEWPWCLLAWTMAAYPALRRSTRKLC